MNHDPRVLSGNKHALVAGSTDNLGADWESEPIRISNNSGISVDVSVDNTSTLSAGDAVGRIYIYVGNGKIWTLWPTTLGDYIQTVSGSDTEEGLDLGQVNFEWIKFSYVRTSGDGIADIRLHENRS